MINVGSMKLLKISAWLLAAILLIAAGPVMAQQAASDDGAEAVEVPAEAVEVPAEAVDQGQASPAAGQPTPAAPAAEEPDQAPPAGADDAAAPAGGAADEAEKDPACRVVRLNGTVQWRAGDKAPWQAAAEGTELATGSDIRTGRRAGCTLAFDQGSSMVELEALTIIRIGEFQRQPDGKVRTRLYLKLGSTKSIVEKTRMESDFAIITPQATMAVQGTDVIQTTHRPDFGTRIALSNSGRIGVTNNQTGRSRGLRPGDAITNQMLLAIENAQFNTAVPVFDLNGGLTQNEQYSILRGPQGFSGVGTQTGPGGGSLTGGSPTFGQQEFLLQQQQQPEEPSGTDDPAGDPESPGFEETGW